MKCNGLGMVTYVLVLVGALNWGLTALGFNLVNLLFGTMPMVENVVYYVVALSAVYQAVACMNCKK